MSHDFSKLAMVSTPACVLVWPMASIRERIQADGSRSFNVQVRMRGYPARSASFITKREAERWAKTIEAQMIEGRHFRSVEARRRTLGEAIDRYLAEELPKKRDGRNHRYTLPWWKQSIGHLKLGDITPAILVDHRSKLAKGTYQRANPLAKRSLVKGEQAKQFKRSNGTVNRYLTCLSHLFTVARKEWHWITYNPFDGVSKLREPKGRVRCLSIDERGRLLAETSREPELYCFVIVALSTACRAGELLKLRWSDVDLHEGRLLFRDTKNSESRTAWLHGESLRLLRIHSQVRRIDTDRVFNNPSGRGYFEYNKLFREACKAAGIIDFRFHDLRHTAATELAKLGASEQQLKAIGGWKSGVVSRYVHLAANDLKDLIARMNNKIFS